MNMKDKESLILNYLGDKILTYRWREYEKIHSLIMRSELNKDVVVARIKNENNSIIKITGDIHHGTPLGRNI